MKCKNLLLMAVFCVTYGQPTNHIQKIYVHSMSDDKVDHPGVIKIGDNTVSLELSRLVFEFSQDAVILQKTEQNRGKGHIQATYIFPKAELSSEAQSMLYKCNNQKNPYFSCVVKAIQKPVCAVELTITYDTERIAYQYDEYSTIHAQKAVVFTFFDKKLLDALKGMESPVLQTAHMINKRPKIVIDCGHGGHDFGACGYHGMVEKEFTLLMGKSLAGEMNKRGWDVVLTRDYDHFVPLDERTSYVNKARADVLVSLHANASKNKEISGIETFFFDHNCLKNMSKDNYYALSGVKSVSDNVRRRTILLAQAVQSHLVKNAQKEREVVVDRKAKQAVMQVLLGSAIPSILIELGFITHKSEALALQNPLYQNRLIHGICNGLSDYFTKILS